MYDKSGKRRTPSSSLRERQNCNKSPQPSSLLYRPIAFIYCSTKKMFVKIFGQGIHKIAGNMTHKTIGLAESRDHCAVKNAHKIVKVHAHMTYNASYSCTVDHDEMKNSFYMKDGLV